MELMDKNILVVGLARSGKGAANLLIELGANVTVTDIKTEEELRGFTRGLNPTVNLCLGSHPEDLFMGVDMIVVSPGVHLNMHPLSKAREKGIPVISEIELAFQIARQK